MTQLRIFDLNDTEDKQVVACLQNGVHTIGRGDLLNVPDKKVSRNHALIDVSESRVVITPTHINPCFYRAANGSNLIVLDKDSETEISDGDQIGLLPDKYWFKLKIFRTIEDVPENNNITSLQSIILKRTHDEESQENDCKKSKISNSEEEPSVSVQHDTVEEDEHRQSEIESSQLNNPEEVEIKEEDIADEEDVNVTTHDNVNIEDSVVVKNERDSVEVKNEDDNGPSSGSNAVQNDRREKCWYGANCYRKNPEHRASFSHPGDQDYVTDPDDNRPDCPYGAACYRTSSDHRKDYKHPTNRPAKRPNAPQSGNNSRKKRKRTQNPSATVYSDSEDDYDYDDPFICDGSSDEYVPSESEGDDEEFSEDLLT